MGNARWRSSVRSSHGPPAGRPRRVEVDECTIERQCEDAFIDVLARRARDYDAICSLGCGAGVQALAERFPKMPVTRD